MRNFVRKHSFHLFFLFLVVLTCCALTTASAQPGKLSSARTQAKSTSGSDSPANFYRRFAEAITDLDGHAVLYFNKGVWETKSTAAGGLVHWRIDDGTIGDFRVTYSNKALVSAELKFNKPVHIWLPVNGGVSFAIQDLQYDQNGILVNDDRKADNPRSSHYQGSSRIDRIFGIATSPDSMLKGELFSNFDSIGLCDSNNQNCAPQNTSLVYEVELKTVPGSPALSVALGPAPGPGMPNVTTLPIVLPSLPGYSPNYLDLQAGSSVVIYSLTYFVDEHYLTGKLSNLTLRIVDGQIGTGDLSLTLTSGSSLTLQNLSFTHDPSAPATNQVSMDGGYLAAGIAGGSKIQFSRASPANPAAESYIVTRDGSSVELKGLAITQNDSGSTSISWQNSSKEKLYIQSGVLNIGSGAFVNLSSSSSEMNVAGTWTLGKQPAISATDVEIEANVNGAQLPISSATVLLLGSGHLHGDHLSIDSTTMPIVRGTISELDVAILPQTTVAFPGAVRLVTTGGGRFHLDPSSPALQIGLGSNYPVGSYILDVPFSVFDNSSGAKNFELQNGKAYLPTEMLADGTIQTPLTPTLETWTVSGKLLLYPAGGTPLTIDAQIFNGNFHTTLAGHPSLSAMISGTVEQGFVWNFTTPSAGLNGQPSVNVPSPLSNFRAYPIKLALGLTGDAVIPPTQFAIGNDGIATTTFQFDIPFSLTPNAGSGEHEDDGDVNSANGEHGSPDPLVHGWQEVLQVHAGASGDFAVGCQAHLYIAPVVHKGSLNAQVVLNPGSLNLNIVKFAFDQPFVEHTDFEHDGCSVTPLLAAVGGVLGGLPGIIGGVVLGNKINGRIDDLITEKINEFATAPSGQSWTIHYAH